MNKQLFSNLDISENIQKAIKDLGFEEASPIQSEAIPILLQGRDIVGQAETGSGKTAAFAIPVIERLDLNKRETQAIVLCPTRELVVQVAEEFRKLTKYMPRISVVPVYGGQPIDRQLKLLRDNPQVIIGTPGRTMDHMRRKSLKLSGVTMVVLDEADEMLDMGFLDDIKEILSQTSPERQTILFSATMARQILDITKRFQKDPIVINVIQKRLSTPNIKQMYLEVSERSKPEVLARLLDLHGLKLALVFCNTKRQVDFLVETLKTRGFFADALHGDLSQPARDKVMNGFRKGTVEILVATDVAGRGIDVKGIEAVFNYDLPRDDEDYVHRTGRTARAGTAGMAFSFITGREFNQLKRIERSQGIQITRHAMPTLDEVESTRLNTFSAKIRETVAAGKLTKFISEIEALSEEDLSILDIAAALLKMAMDKESKGMDANADLSLPPREEYRKPRPSWKSHGRSDYSAPKRFGSGSRPY